MSALRFVIQIVLGIALPLALQRWDRRRLTPEQQASCWNGATWGAALYAFGPLSMLGWFWVTRGVQHGRSGVLGRRARAWRKLKALGLGAASAAAMVGAMAVLDSLLASALGLPPDPPGP
ncbi:transcriptional regulator [Sorangium sp. So ce131]|uniref:transcriptional regulator n=1 Tax=Sorangium sp. So ce131 TaxID=3133282 RepID=UPI003F63F8BD